MDSQAFTLFHVAISMTAIGFGIVVMYGLVSANRMSGLTALYLLATAATSATGFFFHRDHILPAHIVGVLALFVLLATIIALYGFQLRGTWRIVYVVGVVASLWFNVLVLIVQAFQKIASLHALAPYGSEPPLAIAEGLVFVLFVGVAILALKRFRPTDS